MTNIHASEVAAGERFEFGENWSEFAKRIDADRIREAEHSLVEMLGRSDLSGARFLDVGCGSGLFSLAANRLGATVHSFDFDPESVACTSHIKAQFGSASPNWTIEAGSVLDQEYIKGLGTFDVVYSWGVLHHTGDMARALELVTWPVAPGGQLFIAIYNDQGWGSRAWWHVKRWYCRGGVRRLVVLATFVPVLAVQEVLAETVKSGRPWRRFTGSKGKRGMSVTRDWIDWLGGFPFEFATAPEIVRTIEGYGFRVERVVTTKRWGCNQFVFARSRATPG